MVRANSVSFFIAGSVVFASAAVISSGWKSLSGGVHLLGMREMKLVGLAALCGGGALLVSRRQSNMTATGRADGEVFRKEVETGLEALPKKAQKDLEWCLGRVADLESIANEPLVKVVRGLFGAAKALLFRHCGTGVSSLDLTGVLTARELAELVEVLKSEENAPAREALKSLRFLTLDESSFQPEEISAIGWLVENTPKGRIHTLSLVGADLRGCAESLLKEL